MPKNRDKAKVKNENVPVDCSAKEPAEEEMLQRSNEYLRNSLSSIEAEYRGYRRAVVDMFGIQ